MIRYREDFIHIINMLYKGKSFGIKAKDVSPHLDKLFGKELSENIIFFMDKWKIGDTINIKGVDFEINTIEDFIQSIFWMYDLKIKAI